MYKLEHVSLIQIVTGIATKPRLRKHATKYKNMRKWMVKFLRQFENRGIKIARLHSILVTKSNNLQFFYLILYLI